MIRSLLLTAALGAALTACASTPATQDMPAKVSDGALVGPNGMTLYTFDRDVAGSGKSVCNGPCATLWPALAAQPGASGSGDWMVITRDDGGRQWAYKGKPVYYWSKDAKAGDRTGDGFNNAWRIARP
ncbi:MAG: COG4315 family predicted lipoprotein [Ramlibacter sp.]